MFSSFRFIFVGVIAASLSIAVHADPATSPFTSDQTVYTVRPSVADPGVKSFDNLNVVVFNNDVGPNAQLAVFLPGTQGRPENPKLLLHVMAEQGYRVIGLMYDDDPAVEQVCPKLDPASSAAFREERVYGDAVGSPVQNPSEESIVHRLVMALRYLDAQHPGQNWSSYLSGDTPNWSRIVISGLSQGAGMAAYIAKKEPVARVVLFSCPRDYVNSTRSLAPWIYRPSATPPDRWFAEYHSREYAANILAWAYQALQIPSNHILVFDLNVPPSWAGIENPYHGSTVLLPGYISNWQYLYGKSP